MSNHALCTAFFPVHSDYQAKSGLDSYESAGLDNDVTEGGYEDALAAARMAEEELEARDDAAGGRRGRKRMPGALEGAQAAFVTVCNSLVYGSCACVVDCGLADSSDDADGVDNGGQLVGVVPQVLQRHRHAGARAHLQS